MIPYFNVPIIPLGPLQIHAFGVLVAIGILVGAHQARYRSRQLGLSDAATSSLVTWAVVGAFVMAHLFDVVAYQTKALLERPFAEQIVFLLDLRQGISSFGGFLGAFLAMLYFTRKEGYPLLAAADVLIYGLTFGWVLGRLGCFSAHDHPGNFTSFFLGVRYPEGTRHDLGLDEALFALSLSVLFYVLSRKPRRNGFYVAVTCICYGPVRFCFDFLRVRDVGGADPRYFGLTPAQYGSMLLVLVGIGIALYIRRPEHNQMTVKQVQPASPTKARPPRAKT